MRVKCLKINSFRGISNMTLEFYDTQPTVFIGVNGVGKSSILDCLTILISKFIAPIQFDPQSTESCKKRWGFDSYREWEQIRAKGRFFNGEDIKNGYNDTQNEISISLENSADLRWSFNFKEDSETLNKDLGELEQVTTIIRDSWKSSPEANIPLAVYYPVNRTVSEVNLEITNQNKVAQVNAYEKALDGGNIGFRSFFQWFRAVEDVENEELRENPRYRDERLEAVRQAIYSLLGEEFSKLRVRRSPLRMTIKKQSEELIIDQLSDGEKGLLAMVGDLARRLAIASPGLCDPLQGSGVVLIDEIELHLHPKWQREIIPALTRTKPFNRLRFA
ncbi:MULTISPECIES: AAA family ATPase [unclassified Coleofasciculus]|uniref:AAA family ATPase n=1 Tax=unclassified Coleofasciculus TaxID=2692782 RepID=UPI001882C3DF|nr:MULTISPECIES: AAA family ATPase [unclassified Coleofasciculus]MBE9129000.1 AAA family ATPase [Coleofasciculus sp. LEGE 07081]MBE9151579.1 AAA family ATPase [Coleofasciculus sp. LEGE 07092]